VIVALTSGTTATIDRVGGKSLGLVRLMRAGLRVPEAWVIPASVSLERDQRKVLLEEELPAWWENAPKGQLWAVRSSAVAEDLEDASFAGVYETKLGLDSLAGVSAAIEGCWAALTSARAETYRAKAGTDAARGIALIIQRMICPKTAGVMLTADPMRPFDKRLVIDAAWGLGEAVVSAATDPDHYVLDRDTHAQISRRIGDKAIEIVYDRGLQTREVEPERSEVACLTDANLRDLAQIADRVGRLIGPRRDLEWAFENDIAYVLQDRPIVGLPSVAPKVIYSRKWGDEYHGEYCLPLTEHLVVERVYNAETVAFARLLNPLLQTNTAVRVHNGYCYLSGEFLAETIKGIPPSARDAMIEHFPPDYRARVTSEPLDITALLRSLSAPLRARGRSGIRENLTALEQHCANIDRRIKAKLHRDYTTLSDAQLQADHDEVNELVADHYRIISWGMGLYNGVLHSLLPRLLKKWSGDESGELYEALIGGLPGTHTSQVNREVWELGRLARGDAGLAEAVRTETDLTKIAEIRETHPAPAFWTAFDRFLHEHGHRTSARDISNPRWREQPEMVLSLIVAQVRASALPASPAKAEHLAAHRRKEAERTALDRAGLIKRSVLKQVIKYTQKYTVYRENQRYYIDLMGTQLRNIALERGRRFVEHGHLDDPSDVFFLRGHEFAALSAGQRAPDNLRERIAARCEHFLRYRDRLPAAYLYDDVEVDAAAVDDVADEAFGDGPRGVGLCRGTARGTTIVVRSLAQLADVKAGDILVAGAIDPAWTSVFPLIGGLVTEIGGVLSHGAILAREYGIPTVSSVKGATTLLATGTVVDIDGGTGAVTIVSPLHAPMWSHASPASMPCLATVRAPNLLPA